MIRSALSFMFGAAIAAPFAVILATQPIPRTPVALEAAVYTAVEDGKVSDAVYRARLIELDTVTVTGQAPRVASKRPGTKPPSAPACRLHRLEQGASPSAPFVLACG